MSVLLENILNRLDKVKRQGRGYVACCPVHGDKNPSMRIKEVDGKILMHCHACHADIQEIAQAIGIEMSDLFEDSLSEHSRYRAQLNRLQREVDTLDNTILFYQIGLENGDLTAKDKIQYVNHIESRRQMLLEIKQTKQRLIEI